MWKWSSAAISLPKSGIFRGKMPLPQSAKPVVGKTQKLSYVYVYNGFPVMQTGSN